MERNKNEDYSLKLKRKKKVRLVEIHYDVN